MCLGHSECQRWVHTHTHTMSSPLEKPQIIAHVQKSVNYTLFDCRWIPCSAKFVCMGNLPRGSGILQIYEIQHGEAKLVREVSTASLGGGSSVGIASYLYSV